MTGPGSERERDYPAKVTLKMASGKELRITLTAEEAEQVLDAVCDIVREPDASEPSA